MNKKPRVDHPFLHVPDVFTMKNIMQECLLPYLPVISILSFIRAYPSSRHHLFPRGVFTLVWERITTYLNMKTLLVELCDHQQHNYMLTGGALLAALNNDTPQYSDIDFCREDREFVKPIPGLGLIDNNMPMAEVHYDMHVVRDVYQFSHDSHPVPIQLIHVLFMDQFMISFDLSFCANFLNSNRLVIKDPVAVLKRSTIVDANTYLESNRLNQATPVAALMERANRKQARHAKYKERNYRIMVTMTHTTIERLISLIMHLWPLLHNTKTTPSLLKIAAKQWVETWRQAGAYTPI